MNIFNDFILINKVSFKSMAHSLIKGWPIIFTGILYSSIMMGATILLRPLFIGMLGMIGGMILYLINSAIYSDYLYILSCTINYGKFTVRDLQHGYKVFFSKVLTVFFIIYVAEMLLSLVSSLLPIDRMIIGLIKVIIIFILFNPLPEIIYQKQNTGLGIFEYSIEFMKENWVAWLVPNAIFIAIIYLISGHLISDFTSAYNMPFFTFTSASYLIKYLITQSLFSIMMIYRGHLFKLLSTTSRRKRMFMREMY